MDAVHLNAESALWMNDLCRNSLKLSHLANEICAVDYRTLYPEHAEWDEQNGNEDLPDPLRNALKLQKFGISGGNGLFFSAANAASNSLPSVSGFHPYTPVSTGALCRAAVEQMGYSLYLCKAKDAWDLAGRGYRVFEKGIQDFHWGRNRSDGRERIIANYQSWARSKSISKKPKYDPGNELKAAVTVHEDPYGFLSDFVHGNPLVLSLSIIDVQEELGLNRQFDYWALAIAFEVSLAVCQQFMRRYEGVVAPDQEKRLRALQQFAKTFELRRTEGWGKRKPIPDRDFE